MAAQEVEAFPRHYLEVRVGDPIVAEYTSSIFGGHYHYYHPEPTGGAEKGDIWTGHYTQPYRKSGYTLPSFTVAYHYALRHWLHIGPVVSYYSRADRYYDMRTQEHLYNDATHLVSLMADVRFQYFDRRIVGIYSGIGLGVGLGANFRNDLIGAPAWQLTALGLRVGNRVYWNMELGFGTEGFGQMGIGCRF